MSSRFAAKDPANYEQLMGRWSRRLAPLFIAHAGITPNASTIDIGCGTGSLTLALAESNARPLIEGIDFAQFYVDFLRTRTRDPRIHVDRGDAAALGFPDAQFDAALCMLVVQHVADPARVIAEMRRVTRPGGVVAACVWDTYGGVTAHRMFWDLAASLDPAAARARSEVMSRPVARPNGLAELFGSAGLAEIDEISLMIRMDFADFGDFWEPLLAGEGSLGAVVATLDEAPRARLRTTLSDAYRAGSPDGPRSFTAVAWSCRGVVPA